MISGKTKLIAHLGYPTETFRAPMIYNPYFEKHGIDAVVVPMGITSENYAAFLPLLFRLSNIHGALITMPHKVTTVALLDEVTATAAVAGSCNAVRLDAAGRLVGDIFDGEGFVRGARRKGRKLEGARALVVGRGRRWARPSPPPSPGPGSRASGSSTRTARWWRGSPAACAGTILGSR